MENFSFIQITDHHLLESEEALRAGFSPGYSLRRVMKHIAQNAAQKADFIVSSGDLVEPCTPATYECAVKLLGLEPAAVYPGPQHATIEGLRGYPIYFLPGNHDDRSLLTQHLFPKSPAPHLYNFTFQHKGVQFICMDWGPESKAVFLPETRDFLIQSLRSELPCVLVCHQHTVRIGSRWLDNFIADQIDEFWDILTRPGVVEKVLGVLSGHAHITFEEQMDGIPVLGLRSTAYPFAKTDAPVVLLAPPHYRYLTVQNHILTSRIYQVEL